VKRFWLRAVRHRARSAGVVGFLLLGHVQDRQDHRLSRELSGWKGSMVVTADGAFRTAIHFSIAGCLRDGRDERRL